MKVTFHYINQNPISIPTDLTSAGLYQINVGELVFFRSGQDTLPGGPMKRSVTVHEGVSSELQLACMLEELIVAHIARDCESGDVIPRLEVERVVKWLALRW